MQYYKVAIIIPFSHSRNKKKKENIKERKNNTRVRKITG